jgi:hypothetical protein
VVETSNDTVFTLVLDEPLAGGEVGVRYEVAAEDGHVLAGGFSFTVTAPEATTTTSPPEATTTTEDVTVSSAVEQTTSTVVGTIPAPEEGEERSGSLAPLLIAIGLVVGGAGLYAGFRSRSQ